MKLRAYELIRDSDQSVCTHVPNMINTYANFTQRLYTALMQNACIQFYGLFNNNPQLKCA